MSISQKLSDFDFNNHKSDIESFLCHLPENDSKVKKPKIYDCIFLRFAEQLFEDFE
jgi:hypothetical protein